MLSRRGKKASVMGRNMWQVLSITLCDRAFRPDMGLSLLPQGTSSHKCKSQQLPHFAVNYEKKDYLVSTFSEHHSQRASYEKGNLISLLSLILLMLFIWHIASYFCSSLRNVPVRTLAVVVAEMYLHILRKIYTFKRNTRVH